MKLLNGIRWFLSHLEAFLDDLFTRYAIFSLGFFVATLVTWHYVFILLRIEFVFLDVMYIIMSITALFRPTDEITDEIKKEHSSITIPVLSPILRILDHPIFSSIGLVLMIMVIISALVYAANNLIVEILCNVLLFIVFLYPLIKIITFIREKWFSKKHT